MPVKIKKRLRALTAMERVKPTYFRLVRKFIVDEILGSIRSGRSPVGGKEGGRFKKYSDSYIDAMGKGKLSSKKKRPVNLELTGKMLKSIKVKQYRDFVRVWFTDGKAKYHDKLGAGKSKTKRRLTPDPKKGENFNAGIRRRLKNTLEKAMNIAFK